MFSYVNFRPAESDKQKGKKDQDQQENSNDARDPSAEQKERLLAVDEEIADEEDQSIAKEEDISSKSQAPLSVQCLRSLVCLHETSKFFTLEWWFLKLFAVCGNLNQHYVFFCLFVLANDTVTCCVGSSKFW